MDRFRREKYNAFTEEVNKIALNSKNQKRMQSVNLIGIYAYGRSKDLVFKKKKCSNVIKQCKNV